MRFKSLKNDQTVLDIVILTSTSLTRSWKRIFLADAYFETVPSDQKLNRRTCAKECQMPFKRYGQAAMGLYERKTKTKQWRKKSHKSHS